MTERTGEPLRPARRSMPAGSKMDESRHYIDQLRAAPPEEAIPRLIEMLADESWYLRERAGEALASYGLHGAPGLEKLLKSGLWYTRAAALRVLGRIAAPSALPSIVGFLDDPNRAIAEEAARSLLGYCRQGKAVAAAKLLHGRGVTFRERGLALAQKIDPESAARVRRLIQAPLMGPEGSLSVEEEQRIAREITDDSWSVAWERLTRSDPLPEWKDNLIRYLRGMPEA
ncbi:MAG: HEAT repeat domain-containing protein [Candidatus Eisenbacteria bacterium]